MLTFRELAELGFCPKTNYGWGKPLPPDFPKVTSVSDALFAQLPLQLQVLYKLDSVNGEHPLSVLKPPPLL